jgi:hypothetical protein
LYAAPVTRSIRKKLKQSAANILFCGAGSTGPDDVVSKKRSKKIDESNNPLQDVASSLSVAQELASAGNISF